MKLRWKFGIIAGLFLAIFALYPQFKMLYLRGAEWNGHYAYNDIDEVAYAAYLKALIDGRPRKNDPYAGRDDTPENPQPESLFSIQFAAPYTIAIPARILGIGAPWAMTISGAVAAFLTALAIFWLIGMITSDSLFAMAGSLFVLCGGALFAGEGAIGEILGTSYSYPYFPGFRRYLPAMAFPAFFLMVGLVWKIFARETHEKHELDQRSKIKDQRSVFPAPLRSALTVTLTALAFGYTVFSYFYVWTTALAFLGCLGLFWLIARPEGFWKDIKALMLLGLGCVAFLVPYFYLLSKRSHTMDDVQLLVLTHVPDLTRVPEYVSFVTLILLIGGVLIKKLEFADRAVLFAFSLAAVPIVVFNQQIVTGRSLQPIHYEVFIGNYVSGLALIVTIGIIFGKTGFCYRRSSRVVFAAIALVAVGWGFAECHYTLRVLDRGNTIRDQALPVARRIDELSKNDPDPRKSVVLYFGVAEADDLPSIASTPVLWALHQSIFSSLSRDESEARFFRFIYYMNISGQKLDELLRTDVVTKTALFGWGKHDDRLNADAVPPTDTEIAELVARYQKFKESFGFTEAIAPRISYVIVPTAVSVDLSNLKRWYELADDAIVGDYVIYRATPRGASSE